MVPDSVDRAMAHRSASTNSYLAPACDRGKLAVITGVEVHRVLQNLFDDAAGHVRCHGTPQLGVCDAGIILMSTSMLSGRRAADQVSGLRIERSHLSC